LKNKVLLPNGQVSKFTYKNALNAALTLGETAWAAQFLEDYRPFLPKSEQDNIYQYSLAVFYFRTGNYDLAMTQLQKVALHEDVLFSLDARRMLARIYFERKEWIALDSWLASFKTYLKRQKNMGYHREYHLNFIQYLQKMMWDKLQNTTIRKRLHAELFVENLVLEKDWLLGLLET
jgi:hypothetical protein